MLIVLAALALFATPLPALAQNCALCYTQAASAGTRMIQALRSGILILIVPPTLASIGMVFIVYRKRNQIRQTADAVDSNSWEETSLSNSATTPCFPPTR